MLQRHTHTERRLTQSEVNANYAEQASKTIKGKYTSTFHINCHTVILCNQLKWHQHS